MRGGGVHVRTDAYEASNEMRKTSWGGGWDRFRIMPVRHSQVLCRAGVRKVADPQPVYEVEIAR